jgi:hypothetical protein
LLGQAVDRQPAMSRTSYTAFSRARCPPRPASDLVPAASRPSRRVPSRQDSEEGDDDDAAADEPYQNFRIVGPDETESNRPRPAWAFSA